MKFFRIRQEELTENQMSNAKVALVTTVSYFFFHLLYYLLMVNLFFKKIYFVF